MRFGLILPNIAPAPPDGSNLFDRVLAMAQTAEEAGFDTVWATDHVMFAPDQATGRPTHILECFVALGALAAATRRVRLGSYVAGVPYRNPGLLAKMFTTLDVISHGRAIVGIGAAWHAEEFAAYGWPFGTTKERLEKLEDAVHIIDKLMTEPPASHAGRHYAVANARNDPSPIQRPRPPILIGGGGEKVTLRLVARYADACNVSGDPAAVGHKFAVLRAHCAAVGRPYEAITRTNDVSVLIARDEAELAAKRARYASFVNHPLVGTPETIVAGLREFAAIGSQEIVVEIVDDAPLDAIRLFGEAVIPVLASV